MNTGIAKLQKFARVNVIAVVSAMVLGVAAGSAHAAMLYYMPFDDGTSATLDNYGSVGGTATSTGSSATTTSKLGSHSQDFPGTTNNSHWVDLPFSTDILRMTDTADRITIALWVQRDGDSIKGPEGGLVSSMGSARNSGWAFESRSDTTLRFEAQGGLAVQSSATTNPALSPSTWQHVAVTWAPGSGWGVKFYVNGTAFQGSWTGTGPAVNNGNAIRLGNSDLYNPLDGRLDDVAIWDTYLTQGKIRSLSTAADYLGYDAGDMNTLFTVFDTQNTSGVKVNGLRWFYTDTLTGHSDGDTWGDVSYFNFVQFGTGVGVYSIPEPASMVLLALTGLIALRRRRA